MEIEMEENEIVEQKMSETDSLVINELLSLEDNKFYCEKCYDMINYFISECLTMSPQLTELKKRCHLFNKLKSSFRSKYDTLEFNYQEVKTQKEDLEERYNFLIKTLQKKQPSIDLPNEPQMKNAPVSVRSNIIYITDIDADLCNFHIQSNINTHFFLDIDCLTKQLATQTAQNMEVIFQHFAQKANEFLKVNTDKLRLYKKKLAIELVDSKKSAELNEKCLTLEKEKVVKDQELKSLSDENEELKIQNKTLTTELEGFKLENQLLKTSFDKATDSLQKRNLKYEQAENQVVELEKLNNELLEDLKKYADTDTNKSKFCFLN